MKKSPKIMTGKFDGRCDCCQKTILAGAKIKWLAKGVVECMTCANPIAHPTPVTVDSVADQWASAMNWDNEAPKPGASINIDKPAVIAAPVVRASIPAGSHGSKPSPVVSIVPATGYADSVIARANKDSHVLPSIKPEPIAATSDPLTSLLSDQLVTLVNAVDKATGEQRQTLKYFAEQMARASDSPSRARVWDMVIKLVIA